MAGSETSRMSFGTLYDVNKMMYEKMSPMSAEDFQNYMINISLWFSKNNFQYFMFLCRELSDYTIFNFLSTNYNKGREELIDLITSRGVPMDIEYKHEEDAYDIWVKRAGEVHMYKLFPCNDFIIEV